MTYTDAHFPCGSVVAGVRLHPLSMGHALLLARLGCPLIPGGAGRMPAPGDVAMMLWVCSRPWRAAVRTMHRPWWRAWRALMAGRVVAHGLTVIQDARAYLKEQLTGPKVQPSKQGGTRLHSPTLALIKGAAMSDLGLTEEEVLDRPLALTVWETLVAAERRGDVQLAPTLDNFQHLLAAAQAFNPEVPHGQ